MEFILWIGEQNVICSIFRISLKHKLQLIKTSGLGRMWTLQGTFSENLISNFFIFIQMYFSGGRKRRKLHIDTNFPILEPNNFKICCEIIKKLLEINTNQIYFSIKDVSKCYNLHTRIRVFV